MTDLRDRLKPIPCEGDPDDPLGHYIEVMRSQRTGAAKKPVATSPQKKLMQKITQQGLPAKDKSPKSSSDRSLEKLTEKAKRKRASTVRKVVVWTALAISLVCTGVTYQQGQRVDALEKELVALKAHLKQLTPDLTISELKALDRDIEASIREMERGRGH